MTEELRFDGRVVVVTGAGRGIGREHARLLAARGARVVVCDAGVELDGSGASADPAEAVVAEIRSAGGTAVGYTANLATAAGAAEAVECAIAEFGQVDAVIHNAGIAGSPHLIADYPDDELAGQLNINIWAGMWLAKAAIPSMRERGYGRFVFTSSNAIFGTKGMLAYVAAKSAIVGLTRVIALEEADSGIRSNAIAPYAATRMVSTNGAPEFAAWAARFCPPERVAPVAAVLAHESCPINGELLLSSGGRVARIFRGETAGYLGEITDPEVVAGNLDTVLDLSRFEVPASLNESTTTLAATLGDAVDLQVVQQ